MLENWVQIGDGLARGGILLSIKINFLMLADCLAKENIDNFYTIRSIATLEDGLIFTKNTEKKMTFLPINHTVNSSYLLSNNAFPSILKDGEKPNLQMLYCLALGIYLLVPVWWLVIWTNYSGLKSTDAFRWNQLRYLTPGSATLMHTSAAAKLFHVLVFKLSWKLHYLISATSYSQNWLLLSVLLAKLFRGSLLIPNWGPPHRFKDWREYMLPCIITLWNFQLWLLIFVELTAPLSLSLWSGSNQLPYCILSFRIAAAAKYRLRKRLRHLLSLMHWDLGSAACNRSHDNVIGFESQSLLP